ncbi:MAG: TetR/AcrR family transcriptional regulator [Roseburia sp.]|nr:TetR/AcrR family transcriptional regulator [Roseburia sp.]
MEEKKTDLRILKTYKALSDAFFEMLNEMHFEDITVNELCERAMVRRATFYKHFADKYEFFGFFIRQIQDSFNANEENAALSDAPYAYYLYLFQECIHFLQQHKRLLDNVVKSNMFPAMLEIFSDEVYQNVLLHMKQQQQSGTKLPASPELIASFYTGGIIQVLRLWVTSPNAPSEEDLLHEVSAILSTFQVMQ